MLKNWTSGEFIHLGLINLKIYFFGDKIYPDAPASVNETDWLRVNTFLYPHLPLLFLKNVERRKVVFESECATLVVEKTGFPAYDIIICEQPNKFSLLQYYFITKYEWWFEKFPT